MNAKYLSAAFALVLFVALAGCNTNSTAANQKALTADVGTSYGEKTLPLDRETVEWNRQQDAYDENQQFIQRDGDIITPNSMLTTSEDVSEKAKTGTETAMESAEKAVDEFMSDANHALDAMRD